MMDSDMMEDSSLDDSQAVILNESMINPNRVLPSHQFQESYRLD
jgi:hypothetical protein